MKGLEGWAMKETGSSWGKDDKEMGQEHDHRLRERMTYWKGMYIRRKWEMGSDRKIIMGLSASWSLELSFDLSNNEAIFLKEADMVNTEVKNNWYGIHVAEELEVGGKESGFLKSGKDGRGPGVVLGYWGGYALQNPSPTFICTSLCNNKAKSTQVIRNRAYKREGWLVLTKLWWSKPFWLT